MKGNDDSGEDKGTFLSLLCILSMSVCVCAPVHVCACVCPHSCCFFNFLWVKTVFSMAETSAAARPYLALQPQTLESNQNGRHSFKHNLTPILFFIYIHKRLDVPMMSPLIKEFHRTSDANPAPVWRRRPSPGWRREVWRDQMRFSQSVASSHYCSLRVATYKNGSSTPRASTAAPSQLLFVPQINESENCFLFFYYFASWSV